MLKRACYGALKTNKKIKTHKIMFGMMPVNKSVSDSKNVCSTLLKSAILEAKTKLLPLTPMHFYFKHDSGPLPGVP